MVYTPAKLAADIKPNTINYKGSKYPKYDSGHLGALDQKNIDACSKQVTSRFTDVDRYQNLVIKINQTERVVKLDSLSVLRNYVRRNSIRVSLRDLELTLARINGLREDEEEDEYGEIINPTDYATVIAIELISKAAKLIPSKFFKAWVSTEDSGGISLTWSKPELEKEVRLIIPPTPDRKIYLYHEKGAEYGVEYNVSAKTLGYWLSWCNSKVNDR
jgi:hypothetical protein